MSGKSRLLYELMLRKGYPEEFSRLICAEMSTDFTAEKMMSYVSGPKKRLEDVADAPGYAIRIPKFNSSPVFRCNYWDTSL